MNDSRSTAKRSSRKSHEATAIMTAVALSSLFWTPSAAPANDQVEFFEKKIRPALVEH